MLVVKVLDAAPGRGRGGCIDVSSMTAVAGWEENQTPTVGDNQPRDQQICNQPCAVSVETTGE